MSDQSEAAPVPGAAAPSVEEADERRSLFRNPNFAFFWCARGLSSLSYQMIGVVVGWQIYALTGSTLYLGLAGLVQFLPMLLLTLPAGHVADRYSRRVIIRTCQAIEGCVAAALAIGSATGLLSVGWVFAAVSAIGAMRTFESPTMSALLPGLVPTSKLQQAMALSASAMQTATIIGPALGGLIYIAGPGIAYGVVACFYLLAALSTTLIRHAAPGAHREPPSIRSLLSGIAFIRAQPIVLGAISLDLFAVLLGGATALLPVFARDILLVGPVGLGVLRAAPAAGALITSAVLARYPLRRRVGRTMFIAVTLFGLATCVFGLSRSFPLSLAALYVLGSADVVSVVIRSSLVQLSTPDVMRGRVSAVNMMFVGTSNQFGEFESGITAALFGTVPAVLLGGVGTIIVALLWMRFFPKLRNIDRLGDVAAKC
jgi:MFS family permease